MNNILWEPSSKFIKTSNIYKFQKLINTKYNLENVKTGFNYLIQIPLYHLSEEKIVELENIITDLQKQYG